MVGHKGYSAVDHIVGVAPEPAPYLPELVVPLAPPFRPRPHRVGDPVSHLKLGAEPARSEPDVFDQSGRIGEVASSGLDSG